MKDLFAAGLVGIAALFLAVAPPSTVASAAPQTSSTGPHIRVHTDLVVLQVVVTDPTSQFVPSLSQDDFQVFEDRVPQPITFFVRDEVPASIGLVVDNSGSMRPKTAAVAAAARAFVLASNPANEVFVIHFNENVWAGLPDGVSFSRDPAVLFDAVSTIRAVGMTALYDAVDRALDALNLAANLRKILVVISDGGDNASRVRLKPLLDRASRSSVVIYALGLFDDDSDDRNPDVLKQLAAATGGNAYFPDSSRQATGVLERVASDIRSAYTIGYEPTNAKRDGSYRKVTVSLREASAAKRFRVRARDGYLAPSDSSGVQ
jgi:VWFA-related protein